MTCVAMFTVSSFLCGLAPNLGMLIFFRILQGAGGGGLQPSEQAILADTFSPAKRGMAFAVYGMAVVVAPAIGPTLGGWITDNYSWRWIFFINIPVGHSFPVADLAADQDPPYLRAQEALGNQNRLHRPQPDGAGPGTPADRAGQGAARRLVRLGLHPIVLRVIAVAALLTRLYWEWKNAHPVIDLHCYRRPSFAVSNAMMFMLGFVLLGSTLLMPLFAQTMLGYTGDARRAWR